MTNAVLANAAELSARTIEKLNTDAISTSVAGSEITRQTTYNTAQVIFQHAISNTIAQGTN